MVALTQSDLQIRKFPAHVLEQLGQMIPQHGGRGAYADLARLASLQLAGDGIEIREKGLNELIELLAVRGESEGPPLKKRYAEIFLQLRNLTTHGGLLDAIWDI